MSEPLPEVPPLADIATPETIPPFTFVAIVDGVVVQRMSVDPDTAAVLASSPTFVQVNQGAVIPRGSTYANGAFTPPETTA